MELGYDCHGCGNERWLSHVEARTPGFVFVCPVCNVVNKITPITISCIINLVNITSSPSTTNISTSIPPKKIQTKEICEKVVKIIQTYGYTKKEGRRLVNAAYANLIQNNKPITHEVLLKHSFALVDK